MAGAAASWEVHATVDEPVELLVAFAAHYLALGAAEVNLALDRPTEAAVETLRRIDGVRLTLCDEQYWQQARPGLKVLAGRLLGRPQRPPDPLARQVVNARIAYRTMRSDWLLVCDADEFVHARRPVAELLAALPATAPLARLHMAERAFLSGRPPASLFEGVFRLEAGVAWPPDAAAGRGEGGRRRVRRSLAAVYGAERVALLNRKGLLGHGVGKSFTRRGLPLAIDIHFPRPQGKTVRRTFIDDPAWQVYLDDALLLHFDGLTPLHWQLKLLRKHATGQVLSGAADPGLGGRTEARKAQIRAVHAARGDAAALARLVEGLVVLSPPQAARLVRAGLAAVIKPGIAAAVTAALGPAAPDLAPASFDRRLRDQHAALIAQTGFAG